MRKNVKGKGIVEIRSRGCGDKEQRFGTENDGVLGVPFGHAVEEGWASGWLRNGGAPGGSDVWQIQDLEKGVFGSVAMVGLTK